MDTGTSTRADRQDHRLIVQFVLGGALVALAIGLATALVLRDAARSQVEAIARATTELAARGIVEPALEPDLLAGDEAALERFGTIAQERLLDGTTVRVKLWKADGTVIYSDRESQIGRRYKLGDDGQEVLRDGGTVSEVTDLDRPENSADRRFDRLLEVYTQVRAPDGTALLYETYVRDAAISRRGIDLWKRLLPATLGALLLLELVQVPLALVLARRLGARRRERELLLRAAIDAGDLERQRIARDLHDGVVQRLAGIGMHLHAASLELGTATPAAPDGVADAVHEPAAPSPGNTRAVADTLHQAATEVRQSMRELRTLMVDIYPPNLDELGLEQALRDLVSELPGRDVAPSIDVQLDRPLDVGRQRLIYRVAQEAVRNVERHSNATSMTLSLHADAEGVLLCVSDDGKGFDSGAASHGHMGLVLLNDLVTSAGGRLDVSSAPGVGTTIKLTIGDAP